MEITRNQSGSVTLLQLNGRLDLASGATLKEKARKEFDEGNVKLHLNMAQIDFINSSGLGALVSLMKETRLRHGRLTLSDLAAYVKEIFEITQLSHIFEIYSSEEEAIASYETAAAKR
ncbi:MAG: STAS domain-containing protein [Candidatus Zixiibacteriota bacterium]